MQLHFFKFTSPSSIRIWRATGVIIIAFLVVSIPTWASGINHRDIFVGASARAVGMGSAFTAGPAATSGFLWNPSSLGFMDGVEVNMGGMPFSGSSSGLEQAFSIAANPHTFGLTDKNVGNLSVATWLDGWQGDTTDSTQIVLLGYGFALGRSASVGANLRYYQNSTPSRTNFLWSLDLGMQFTYPLKKSGESADSVTVGVNLSELSNGIRMDGVLLESVPLAARFGTTYQLGGETLFSVDLAVRGENSGHWGERLRLHLGAERWLIRGHLGLRLGYTALMASERVKAGEWARGFSFRNSSGQLDYAYVSGKELEQSIHWLSATLRWGTSEAAPLPEPTLVEPTVEIYNPDESIPILMPTTLTTETGITAFLGELRVSEHAISPNNDGFADSTTFHFNASADTNWRLALIDEYTESVWEQSGRGAPIEGIIWNGIADTGKLVPDGNYEAHLHVLDVHGTPHLIDSAKITVDVIPTTLEIFRKAATINQHGTRGWYSVGIKTLDLNPLARWKMEIFDASNMIVEQMEGNGPPPTEVFLSSLQTKPLARYTCKLSVQDIAGNQNKQQVQLDLGTEHQAAPKTEQASVNDPQPKLTLMVGSFVEARYAKRLETQLRNQNPNQKVTVHITSVDGKARHRVTIGEFGTREDAAALRQRIQKMLGVEPILITVQ